jgi:hypothetical protein
VSTYEITFANDEVMEQFEAIPDSARKEMDVHFEAVHTATAMRKLPYSAHRNRGVTIRFESAEARVSLHVARDEHRNIEVLGIILKLNSERRAYDFEVIRDVDCTHCGQPAGQPCRLPSGEKADHPHDPRSAAYTGADRVTSGRKDVKESPWTVSSNQIVEAIHGRLEIAPEWGRFFERYAHSHADPKTGRLVLLGGALLAQKRAPEKKWTCRAFSAFIHEKVSGPHPGPLEVSTAWVRRDFGVRRISEQEMRFYLTAGNPVEYAKRIGAVFVPLPTGMILAVEDPSDLEG